MPELPEERIAELTEPYLQQLPPGLTLDRDIYGRLRVYLELLLRWNAKTNLTAVRDAEEIVRRHFGESLFAGCRLCEVIRRDAAVLDLGSGAGFPGIPVQLLLPCARVTLAESQGKKAAFLREAVRVLGLKSEVWAGRAELMETGREFDAVMLRAVDRMEAMVEVGRSRVLDGGLLVEMVARRGDGASSFPVPGSEERFVNITPVHKNVPRGTKSRLSASGSASWLRGEEPLRGRV